MKADFLNVFSLAQPRLEVFLGSPGDQFMTRSANNGTNYHVPCFPKMKYPLFVAVVITIAACAPERSAAPDSDSAKPINDNDTMNGNPVAAKPATPSPHASSGNVLTLEGLGDLRIGRPVPAGSKWAERGAQASDVCRTISSPDYPGVYAIIEQGKVRRITTGQNSAVRLSENMGVGSTEKEVLKSFPGLHAEPHKYVASPAKYLTAPNAASGDSALRFEIGTDGKVSLIHVGMMPVLGYVEGCA
jgi:hypothetical protein